MRLANVGILTLVAISLAGPPVWAEEAELSAAAIYQQTLHGTALVKNRVRKTAGTGWIVSVAERLLITNHHVVRDAKKVDVVFPVYQEGRVVAEKSYYNKHLAELRKFGRLVRGTVLMSDPRRDLAVVQLDFLPEDVQALPLAAEGVAPGERVHLVGNPGPSQSRWVYSTGDVRQVSRQSIPYGKRQKIVARIMESSLPADHGESGSPVVNDRGELVAVHSGHNHKTRLLAYGIDVSEVKVYLQKARNSLGLSSAGEY